MPTQRKFRILGYGKGEPFNVGIQMAESHSEGYACDIAKALATLFPGQVFGVEQVNPYCQLSKFMQPGLTEFK